MKTPSINPSLNQQADPNSEQQAKAHVANRSVELFEKNMPLYLVKGMKKEAMEDLYRRAYNLYSAEAYKEALQLFRSMAFYSHLDKRAWLGAAGCSQMLKEYDHALTFYGFAVLLDLSDPIPCFHMFDCHMSLNHYPDALNSIERVILLSSKNPKHALLKERAESLRDALKKNISGNKKK